MPLSPLPATTTPTTVPPRAQLRRVKRGIVAGYIHDISVRHGDEQTPPSSSPKPLSPARY